MFSSQLGIWLPVLKIILDIKANLNFTSGVDLEIQHKQKFFDMNPDYKCPTKNRFCLSIPSFGSAVEVKYLDTN